MGKIVTSYRLAQSARAKDASTLLRCLTLSVRTHDCEAADLQFLEKSRNCVWPLEPSQGTSNRNLEIRIF